jgi:hypothetical protein
MAVSLTDSEAAELKNVLLDWRADHSGVSAFSPDLQSAFSKLMLPVSPLNVAPGANAGTTVKVKGRDRG